MVSLALMMWALCAQAAQKAEASAGAAKAPAAAPAKVAMAKPAGPVGSIVKIEGQVLIVRGEKEAIVPLVEAGEIKRGELLSGDQVMTVKGGTATVRLLDGSELRLETGCYVSIEEKGLAPAEVKGTWRTKRVIKLMTGRMSWDVVKSETLATEFETPTGVIRVQGTSGLFNVQQVMKQYVTLMKVSKGTILYTAVIGQKVVGRCFIEAGQGLQVTLDGESLVIGVPRGGTPMTITLANNVMLKLDPGEAIKLSFLWTGEIRLEVVRGNIEMQEPGQLPRLLEQGEVVILVPPAGMPTIEVKDPQGAVAPDWPNERRRVISPENDD